jgi:hypothetical protein
LMYRVSKKTNFCGKFSNNFLKKRFQGFSMRAIDFSHENTSYR